MPELDEDWWSRLARALWNSGHRQGELHVKRLQEAGALPPGAARTLLEDIDEGVFAILPFFAPNPIALSTRKSWSRQYDKSRNTTGLERGQTPPLGTINDEEDRGLRTAYIEGMSRGFYEMLAGVVGQLADRTPEELDRIVGQLRAHLDGHPRHRTAKGS